MKNRRNKQRTAGGISTIALILILAFIVVLPLAIFGFEMSRYLLIQDQLRSVADSASLSGCAAMASVPQGSSEAARQQTAMNVAYNTFLQNSILQTNFNTKNAFANYNPQPPTPQTPGLHQAIINIVLLDQNGKQVATGTPAATMQVQAYYTDAPIFAYKLMNLGTAYTASAFSSGGLPSIDVILCFDVSGSMDDQTNVMFYKRYWNGGMTYTKVAPTGKVSDTIFAISNPANTGTSFNIFPPENLSYASYGSPSNKYPYVWSEAPNSYPAPTALKTLRANTTFTPTGALTAEQGLPPGNFNNGSVDPAADPTAWTDCVVDVSNGAGYPVTVNGFLFSNPQTVIEASRGNMEDDKSIKQACGNNIPAGVFPPRQQGYFKAYWNYVMQNSHPIQDARDAAYTFFNTMNISANSRFGFIAFSDGIGSGPQGNWTITKDNLDANYATGGTNSWNNSGFPLPYVALDANNNTATQSYDNAITAVTGSTGQLPVYTDRALVALGKTNIADALNQAIADLNDTTKARKTSKKAIILFTDGVPNLPTDNPTGTQQALNAAKQANKLNFPIYTIGLSQVPQIKGAEDALLNATAGSGIAGISGNGALYIPVTSNSALQQAFQTVARSLCVLQ